VTSVRYVGTEKAKIDCRPAGIFLPCPPGAAWSMEHLRRPAITIAARQKRPGSDEGHPQEAMVKATSGRGELQYRQDWQKDSATGSCIQGEQGSFRMF
jgi:hypothetical protein